MISLDEPPALQSASVDADRVEAVGSPADYALLATLATRMHCRRPMQVVEPAGPSLSQPLTVGAAAPVEVPRWNQAAEADVVTYRCACGFTIDLPSAAGIDLPATTEWAMTA
jgi:hypothetical protein